MLVLRGMPSFNVNWTSTEESGQWPPFSVAGHTWHTTSPAKTLQIPVEVSLQSKVCKFNLGLWCWPDTLLDEKRRVAVVVEVLAIFSSLQASPGMFCWNLQASPLSRRCAVPGSSLARSGVQLSVQLTTWQTFLGKKHNSCLADINQGSVAVCTTVASGKEFASLQCFCQSTKKGDGLAWMDYLTTVLVIVSVCCTSTSTFTTTSYLLVMTVITKYKNSLRLYI